MLPGISQYAMNPYVRGELMKRLMNEGSNNVLPILPLEAGSLSSSFYALTRKGGHLDFRERMLDEVMTSITWLFGVKFLDRIVRGFITKQQSSGRLQSLNVDIDWSRGFLRNFLPGKRVPSVTLSPMEKFSKNHKNIFKTLGWKSLIWLISVAIPVYLTGWGLTRLCQWMTRKTLGKQYSEHKAHQASHTEPSVPEKTKPVSIADELADEPRVAKPTRPSLDPWGVSDGGPMAPYRMAQSIPNYSIGSTMGHRPPYAPYGIAPNAPVWNSTVPYDVGMYTPSWASNGSTNSYGRHYPSWASNGSTNSYGRHYPRFGNLGLRLLSGMGYLGHFVDNTAYGQVLVVDAGLVTGRATTELKRSVPSALEALFRDTTRIFFYCFSVPLALGLFGKLFDKPLGVVTGLDQQVMRRVNQEVAHKLGRPASTMSAQQLEELFFGAPKQYQQQLLRAQPALAEKLRQASSGAFVKGLEKELAAFSHASGDGKSLMKATQGYLKGIQVGRHMSADHLEKLLTAIWNRQGPFKALTDAQCFNLSTSAKLAFHHHAGLSESALKQVALQSLSKKALPPAQLKALSQRIQQAAQRGGDSVIVSMMRRSFNVASYNPQFVSGQSSKQVDAVIRAMEQATLRGGRLQSFVPNQLRAVLRELVHSKTADKALLEQAKVIENALKQPRGVLTTQQLTTFAELLEQNGRTWPKGFRWLQGPGLGHLASEVRAVVPLVDNKTPVHQLMSRQVDQTFKALHQAAQAPSHRSLLKEYQASVARLLRGEGRVSAILTKSNPRYEQLMVRQANQILLGGMARDEKLARSALKTLNQLPLESESFFGRTKLLEMQRKLYRYMKIANTNAQTQQSSVKTVEQLMEGVMKPLANKTTMWRYAVWIPAVVASALAMAVAIPYVQYWMTRKLTGRDEHPGIAAVSNEIRGNV